MSIEHKLGAPKRLRVGILTISDTRAMAAERGLEEDISGVIIERELGKANHETLRRIVPDEEDEIRAAVEGFISDHGVDAVITTGGTGLTFRDVTIEALSPLFEKELPGFGEILRRIGYERVGAPAMLTRATAGLIKRRPVFCLPGNPNAVEAAMELILPELGHIVKHARE